MESRIGIIAEVFVLILNLLIFMNLTILKRDNITTRLIMYSGTLVMIGAFFACTFCFRLPEAISSFVCVTIPSSTLFFILSKYKDMRFFVTFCFLDTVTLVFTFLTRATEISFGVGAGIAAYAVLCVLMLIIYIKGRPYFKKYRELIEEVKDGWGGMAISTLLIYILLIFTASYPTPMRERPEYIMPFVMLSVTLLSFYYVFISTLLQKRKLYELNIKLQREKLWHDMAYIDALTGMKNRMAYIERINQLERQKKQNDRIFAIMMDLDNFKNINDTLGHHTGDTTLKKAAQYLAEVFSEGDYEIFRIGGDEFAVIAVGVTEETVMEKLTQINENEIGSNTVFSFSVGCSEVQPEQNNSLENAFIRADSAMYKVKSHKKSRA